MNNTMRPAKAVLPYKATIAYPPFCFFPFSINLAIVVNMEWASAHSFFICMLASYIILVYNVDTV